MTASFADRIIKLEEHVLSCTAARSYPAQRQIAESECALRTPFQRDRDRILHCKAFRRLKHKTQVFVSPAGDHYRTRLTHTLEVSQISRTVARALRLNEDLTEAVSLGHDLGHAPFGHIGEEALNSWLQRRTGRRFRHYEHSLRIVEKLERDGQGLNLTTVVRDGIVGHSGGAAQPKTLEGKIVRIVDRVAYINHDIDDALRAGALQESQLPKQSIAVLGRTSSERIDKLVHDIVKHSEQTGEITQGQKVGEAMANLRDFMFEHVYLAEAAQRDQKRIERVLVTLADYYVDHLKQIPDQGNVLALDDEQRVIDYVAGMTDRYAIRAFSQLMLPQAFENERVLLP